MPAKILLIDDDKIVLRTIEKLLTKEGYALTIVDSGQKALDAAKNSFFDLIISDIRMPHLDGIQTIKKIKKLQQERTQKTKFMVITAYPDEGVSQNASEMQINQFLIKPFDKEQFLAAIETTLEEKNAPAKEIIKESEISNKTLIDYFIKEQKEKNKSLLLNKKMPVMGWVNTYVPEEILMAAGFFPYRIMGAPCALSLSKAYLSGNINPSVQSILECALKGDYKFLDGVIIGGSTDATKRLFDVWKKYVNTPFCQLFDIPKLINEGAVLHYTESVNLLIEEMQKHFKINLNDSDIKEAVSICNKTRSLLTALNDLRKLDNPPVTSQQFLEVCKLAVAGDKKNFNSELEALIRQIKPAQGKSADFRLLLMGSFQDQPWLLDAIEERGVKVVCEDFCTRLRYFSGLVEDDEDIIKALARRYIQIKLPSASLVSLEERSSYILKLIKEFKVDGVIYYILKFDDPYLFEFPDMKEILSANNVPVLRIETEHNTNAIGQIMTRIEAFMETLNLRKPSYR